MQESLRQLTDQRNPADSKIFQLVDAKRLRSLTSLCTRVRKALGVDLSRQRSWPSLKEAVKRWRDVIETNGVFVFKRSFKQRDISGFCLSDDEFPSIYLNNSTSDSRQIFTLFHELAHLLYNLSGITKQDVSYIESLSIQDRRIEVLCNRFSAAFLVPEEQLREQLIRFSGGDEEILALAKQYNVSREVIARKLLDMGFVSQDYYERKACQWNEEYESRPRRKGGSYYATQTQYLGKNYLRLAFSSYKNGHCSLQELAGHLNMRARNVERLEANLIWDA